MTVILDSTLISSLTVNSKALLACASLTFRLKGSIQTKRSLEITSITGIEFEKKWMTVINLDSTLISSLTINSKASLACASLAFQLKDAVRTKSSWEKRAFPCIHTTMTRFANFCPQTMITPFCSERLRLQSMHDLDYFYVIDDKL